MNQNLYTKYQENNKNTINITIDGRENPIKANIIMQENNFIKICGDVKNCENIPLSGILIKIYQIYTCDLGRVKLNKISETISNRDGFYTINIPFNGFEKKYRLVAEKNFFPSDNGMFYKPNDRFEEKINSSNYSPIKNNKSKFSSHRYVNF
ncbi:MAG: hypothetical protein KFW09_06195 [Oscillospiraceae bacterium]|nr:hypothetical protein [Oscillospiraceae bacterium]